MGEYLLSRMADGEKAAATGSNRSVRCLFLLQLNQRTGVVNNVMFMRV